MSRYIIGYLRVFGSIYDSVCVIGFMYRRRATMCATGQSGSRRTGRRVHNHPTHVPRTLTKNEQAIFGSHLMVCQVQDCQFRQRVATRSISGLVVIIGRCIASICRQVNIIGYSLVARIVTSVAACVAVSTD
jgi:hypothetical protein